MQQSLFMPLLTRIPKARVKAQVICLASDAAPAAVLRQSGAPVHDVSLSRRRFSLGAFAAVARAARIFRPDVIQAWGCTAQIVAVWVRSRCESRPKLVWSVAETAPLARNAGLIDRWKLRLAAKLSRKVDRIVYTSEAGASQHRRVGFPDGAGLSIAPGVDAARFKPDAALRRKVREQLHIAPDAFVIGMLAPFQPDYDHATLLKAAGELIKTHPQLTIMLAGRGVQKGNAALMALVGGGALGTRTHLLGEWSDAASFFNACDAACSTALTDRSRMTLVMAMLCGAPCVATGMGAQGEVLGHAGAAIEPGSPAALIKSLTRIMQLAPERRVHMVHNARKHALKEYVYVRSLQKYVQLYCELLGREVHASDVARSPAMDDGEAGPPAPALAPHAPMTPVQPPIAERVALDSSSAQVANSGVEPAEFSVPPETPGAQPDTPPAVSPALSASDATDVLKILELGAPETEAKPSELAERIADDDDCGDLLAPEALAAETVVRKAPTPHQKASSPRPATPESATMDAAARMRAAARAELQRAAAAMSAPKKDVSPPSSAASDELQLDLLSAEPLKHASGRGSR